MVRVLIVLLTTWAASGEQYDGEQQQYPTGLYFEWKSSDGDSGTVEYLPGAATAAVPDEGTGGIWRRLVLAPREPDCAAFPPTTNNYRGQEGGVPYDTNVFVMYLADKNLRCSLSKAMNFGDPQLNATPAGAIWMWSDLNDPTSVHKRDRAIIYGEVNAFAKWKNGPTASIARDVGPTGGLDMARKVFDGQRVDLLWPGTGPLTDENERSALRDLYKGFLKENGGVFFDGANGATIISPRDFLFGEVECVDDPNGELKANGVSCSFMKSFAGCDKDMSELDPRSPKGLLLRDKCAKSCGDCERRKLGEVSVDPCSGDGTGMHLIGVTCIGGHVVALTFLASPVSVAQIPASIGQLKHLRLFVNNVPQGSTTLPCEIGTLTNLVR